MTQLAANLVRCTAVALAGIAMWVGATAPGFSADGSRYQEVEANKFCLFSFGLTKDENAYMTKLILGSDGGAESRRMLVNQVGRFCTFNMYQAMTSCFSFSKDLKDCLILFRPSKQ